MPSDNKKRRDAKRKEAAKAKNSSSAAVAKKTDDITTNGDKPNGIEVEELVSKLQNDMDLNGKQRGESI